MDFPWIPLLINLAVSAATVMVIMGILMAVSSALRNHSIIDMIWGPGFVVIAVVSFLLSLPSDGDLARRLVVLGLTAIWGLRLGFHVGLRNVGQGEDPRYTALMKHRTGNLVIYLIRHVYGLQALLMFLISVPVQVAMYEQAPLGVLGIIGIAVWVLGFSFEAIGDQQLKHFRADPDNRGKVMNRGLWAWTRHPNYFGDTTVWFAMWILALGHWAGLFTVFSPLLMAYLLLKFSGKALLEKRMLRSKGEAYAAYVATTSGFFPLPPKRRTVR